MAKGSSYLTRHIHVRKEFDQDPKQHLSISCLYIDSELISFIINIKCMKVNNIHLEKNIYIYDIINVTSNL